MRECERQEPSKLHRGSSLLFRRGRIVHHGIGFAAHHCKGAGAHNLHRRPYQNEPMLYIRRLPPSQQQPSQQPPWPASGHSGRSNSADSTHNSLCKPQDRSQSSSDYLLRKPQLPPRPQDIHGGNPSGFSGFLGGSLVIRPPSPSNFQAGRPAQLQVLRALPVNLRQVQVANPAPSRPFSSPTDPP